MRRTTGLLTLGLAAMLLIPQAALAAARLEVVEPSRDLGVVTKGERLELEFEIANTGDEELELNVRPACGCTVVRFDERIAPGATGTIAAAIDTSRLKKGVISKSILITSNDPEEPTRRLVVRAKIVEPDAAPRPERQVDQETAPH